ncbi:MAG: MarR family transcriptional regulator [Rhodospirillaceae bacterium]|nr:MarR family transcriptional regulator [Rhodospirillaceae bacterium]
MERTVLHWGEMGSRWGVNRSVGQIHALLYLTGRPLTAEEIAETLSMARSNVSTSLRELMNWHLVRRVHLLGDRRDHFEAEADLWQMLLTIVEGRKVREIDPTLTLLRTCVLEADDDKRLDATSKQRIADMLQFLETLSAWYEDVRRLPKGTLVTLMKMGAKIGRFVGKDRG